MRKDNFEIFIQEVWLALTECFFIMTVGIDYAFCINIFL